MYKSCALIFLVSKNGKTKVNLDNINMPSSMNFLKLIIGN
jgi:hypothetical protein